MDTGKFESLLKRLKSEWKKCLQVWKWFVRVYWDIGNKPMVELESFQIVVKQNQELEEENKKLKVIIENTKIEQKSDREHIEELEEENKKLK